MTSEKRLYIALGVLVVLGGALYFQQQKAKKEAASYSYESVQAELPTVSVPEDATQAITKIVIEKPAKKDGDKETPAEKHVLVKDGENWQLSEPAKALANQSNVESLLKNLNSLEVKERMPGDDPKAMYAQYDLTPETAVHATFFVGDEPKYEYWFGKSGGRGQTARVKGHDDVFVLDGYSSFLYTRDTKGWRDLSILKVEADNVTEVTIDNEHGEYAFKKADGAWEGKVKAEKSPVAKSIPEFEPKKVDDMIRAYKSLNANGFGDDKKPADVGLEEPLAKVVLTLEDGAKRTVLFGSNAEGSSRWAKLESEPTIYSVSSWAADWAFAEDEKFQKGDDEEKPGGAPPGMPGMPGMPQGHPPH